MLRRSVTSLESSPKVPDWWVLLFAEAKRTSIFLTSEWIQTWLDVYGQGFLGQWICWDMNGRVVGGCLILTRVMRKQVFSLRTTYFNATGDATERTPLAEFNDVLFIEPYGEKIANDLAKFLMTQQWDRLFVSGYEPGGVLHMLSELLPTSSLQHEPETAAYVDLRLLENSAFEKMLSANTRSQIKRSQRRYEEQTGTITICRAETVLEAIAYLDQLATFHNERRAAKGEAGTFESNAIVSFHKKLIPILFAQSHVDLLRITSGVTPIGYLYNFVRNGKVYFFQSGFHYDGDAKMKPGLLAHALVIQYYAENGKAEYDFLAGDSQYKRSLTKQSRPLNWSVLYRDNWRARGLLVLKRFFGWLLNKPR